MERSKRKEILNQLAKKKLAEFKNSLPTDESTFSELFDYLDIELGETDCDHTPILTSTFLESKGIENISDVIEWLTDNGGFCDCEVLANVEHLFDYLKSPLAKPI